MTMPPTRACPKKNIIQLFLSWRVEDNVPYHNMALGCQGKVQGRFVPKPPHEISFSLFPDALRTARPTLRFPFECLGAGRAACPQAAAGNPSLIPLPVAVMPSIRYFSLLESLPFKPSSRFFG